MRLDPRFALLAAIFAASPLAGQNYVVNGTFDSSLTGWSVSPSSAQWTSADAGGSSASGSVLLTNGVSGSSEVTIRQCVALASTRNYSFWARTKVASGQTASGQANLRVLPYASADCSGTYISYLDSYHDQGNGVWSGVAGTIQVTAAAQSMAILLVNRKNDTGGLFQTYFDDVWLMPSAPATLTIPSSASIHGNGGTFFHTDLWLMNQSPTFIQTITARYRCFTGQSCPSGTKTFYIAPTHSLLYSDAVGAGLFTAPETAGAIEITYDPRLGEVSAASRVYTPSLPAPTSGTSVPAMGSSEARTKTLFLGLGSNGGNLTSGFRSNAGAYNPNAASASVTFTLYNGPTGAVLGTPVTRTWAANEAFQINDIFAAAAAGSTVTTNAYLVVTSSAPIFPFVTVIDNQSGDSVWLRGFAQTP